jgi:hypothetical protein
VPARSSAQLSRSPGQWKDHQAEERRRNLAALTAELERARRRGDPWYVWLEQRHRGEHHHDLTDENGRAIACPVGGCDAVRGSELPHLPNGGRSSRREPRASTA